LNVFAPAKRSRILDGIGAAWSSAFSRVEILSGPASNGLASHLLFGGPAVPIDTRRYTLQQIPAPLRPGWSLLRHTQPLRTDPNVQPWTDDRAPIELLTDRAYRNLRPANASRSAS
jgi:hypothetical protein